MPERIIIDPRIVRGTRITVKTVVEFLAAGDTFEEVLMEFPSLTREDVTACIVYAAHHS